MSKGPQKFITRLSEAVDSGCLFSVPIVRGTYAALEQRALASAWIARALNSQALKQDPDPAEDAREMKELQTVLWMSVERGDPYAVAPDICDLLERGAPSLPGDIVLSSGAIPAEGGFVYFDKPLPVPGGAFGPLRAMSWVVQYTGDGLDGPSYVIMTGDTNVGANAHSARIVFWLERNGALSPITQVPWRLGTTMDESSHYREHSEASGLRAAKLRYAYAFWAFIQQRLAEQHRVPADRAVRRRLEGLGVDATNSAVMVVRLRHVDRVATNGDGDPVAWSCRWIVSGHWRRQPCGKRSSERRVTWVTSHIKGPEGKPVKAPSTRLFMVNR